jgi:excinuclease ABC subunit C
VQLLRRLRDEAHRFAVSFHRQQRGERMKRSRLSDIPGLGPKRVRDLLAHFRSIDAIQLAGPEQIATAPGVGPALARQVWEYFHPEEVADAAATPPSEDLTDGGYQEPALVELAG